MKRIRFFKKDFYIISRKQISDLLSSIATVCVKMEDYAIFIQHIEKGWTINDKLINLEKEFCEEGTNEAIFIKNELQKIYFQKKD